jgi:hypothetical protein
MGKFIFIQGGLAMLHNERYVYKPHPEGTVKQVISLHALLEMLREKGVKEMSGKITLEVFDRPMAPPVEVILLTTRDLNALLRGPSNVPRRTAT